MGVISGFFKAYRVVISVALFGVLVTTTFQNCSPGFQLDSASEMEIFKADVLVDLKFSETNLDVMTSANPSVAFSVASVSSEYVLKCFVNAVEAATCVSPLNLAGVADGDISLRIVAQDASGKRVAEVSKVFRIDRKAPEITVIAKPAAQIGMLNTAIQFTVMDNLSAAADIAVQCALDAAAFAPCVSPQAYNALSIGAHTIKIKAADKAGNMSAETLINFSVVIGIPTVTISSSPAAISNSVNANFVFAGTSASSTIMSYECSIDNGVTYSACVSPKAYAGLASGVYNFAVRAIDSVGQKSGAATNRFTVDTVLPTTPTVSSNLTSPSKLTDLTLTFSSTDSSGIMKYECSQDGGAFAACTSPKTYTNLTAATHTFKVKSTDQAGNVSLDGSYSVLIDNVSPTLTITAQPASPTTEKTANFQFTAIDTMSGVGTVECQIDTEATYSACTSPKSYSVTKGNRTFAVRATDKAGNVTMKSYSWIVNDVLVPIPKVIFGNIPATTTEEIQSVAFQIENAGAAESMTCESAGVKLESCISPVSVTCKKIGICNFRITLISKAGGSQNFETTWERKCATGFQAGDTCLRSPFGKTFLNYYNFGGRDGWRADVSIFDQNGNETSYSASIAPGVNNLNYLDLEIRQRQWKVTNSVQGKPSFSEYEVTDVSWKFYSDSPNTTSGLTLSYGNRTLYKCTRQPLIWQEYSSACGFAYTASKQIASLQESKLLFGLWVSTAPPNINYGPGVVPQPYDLFFETSTTVISYDVKYDYFEAERCTTTDGSIKYKIKGANNSECKFVSCEMGKPVYPGTCSQSPM